jgi:hypothetical protein
MDWIANIQRLGMLKTVMQQEPDQFLGKTKARFLLRPSHLAMCWDRTSENEIMGAPTRNAEICLCCAELLPCLDLSELSTLRSKNFRVVEKPRHFSWRGPSGALAAWPMSYGKEIALRGKPLCGKEGDAVTRCRLHEKMHMEC